jgi:hypothetical protein
LHAAALMGRRVGFELRCRAQKSGSADGTGYAVERALQIRADELHGRDNHDCDASRDQTVFDGRRARFITHKTRNKVFHVSLR